MNATLDQLITQLKNIGTSTYIDLPLSQRYEKIINAVTAIARPLASGGYSEVFIVDGMVIRVSLGIDGEEDGYHNWMMLLNSRNDWSHAPDISYYEYFPTNRVSFTIMPEYQSVQYNKDIQEAYDVVKYTIRVLSDDRVLSITNDEFIEHYNNVIVKYPNQYTTITTISILKDYLPLALDMLKIYAFTKEQAHVYTDFHDENIMWDSINNKLILTDPIC